MRCDAMRCNATRCDPCGRTACDCSLINEWKTGGGGSQDVDVDTKTLLRPAHYRAMCGTAAGGPLAIHFNGESKAVMKEARMRRWIAESFAL